jgi:GT2 family glycosyltransferase
MITGVFTSCGRFDLLERTLRSFVSHADLPLEQLIVIDNSTLPQTEQEIERIVANIGVPISLIANPENVGQVTSIDIAYSYVDTEYIFHCEDDWEFFDTGFLALSKQLLEERDNIINVNLRVRFDGEKGSMHPISELMTTPSGLRYHEYMLNYLGAWHGFSWNPGLRRKSDYELIKPYKTYGEESGVGRKYKELGYVAACLEKAYCKHIGTHSFTPKSNQ